MVRVRLLELADGTGFGRIRLSVLFKPVSLTLPRGAPPCSPLELTPTELHGHAVGTLHIDRISLEGLVDSSISIGSVKIRISTGQEADASLGAPDEGQSQPTWQLSKPILLPVLRRWAAFAILEFRASNLRKTPVAMAYIWLSALIDDEPATLRLPMRPEPKDMCVVAPPIRLTSQLLGAQRCPDAPHRRQVARGRRRCRRNCSGRTVGDVGARSSFGAYARGNRRRPGLLRARSGP